MLLFKSRYTIEQQKSNFIDKRKSFEGGIVKGCKSGDSHWKSKISQYLFSKISWYLFSHFFHDYQDIVLEVYVQESYLIVMLLRDE